PILINSTPPTISSVSPNSGQLRGGDSIDISGTNFDPSATVTFGGVTATVTSASSTVLTVDSPPGSFEGQVVAVKVTQPSGTAQGPGAFTYNPNTTAVEWTGTAKVGDPVTITIYGPANSAAAVVVGTPGSLTKKGLTFCFQKPFKFFEPLSAGLNTGVLGKVS